MQRTRSLGALGPALLLVVAAALVGPLAGPATAAVCGPGDGVSVVVDARGLGGSLSSACDADGGGKTGAEIVPSVGYPLEYVQRQPGFVCRVSGAPSSDPCVNTPPADAYWGLFWSDGKSGTWSYASSGITSLRIPAGGSIGLAWQDGNGRKAPGTAPPVASSAPKPAPKPSSQPTPKPAPAPGASPGSSGGDTAPPAGSGGSRTAPGPGSGSDTRAGATVAEERETGREQRRERRRARAAALSEAEASASATPSAGTTEADEAEPEAVEESAAAPTASGDGGLPLAVPLVLLGVLAALAVAAAVRRRRGTGAV
ncbi:MAG: hypothetical protein Q8Q02_15400 [Nocardioides sp.]|nr:hypothetical protein [Nocardioides sp.]